MNVQLGNKIDWVEAIKQMCLGKMCAVTFYGNSKDRYFFMKDSTDSFRMFDLNRGVFEDSYLDADDIMEGVWNECENMNLAKRIIYKVPTFQYKISVIEEDGLYYVNENSTQLIKNDIVCKLYDGYEMVVRIVKTS